MKFKIKIETIFLLFWLNFDLITGEISVNKSDRPEQILLNVLTRPLIFNDKVSSSDACQKDSEIYQNALENYEPWALQMFDASSKISSGIITGNYKQLGNYDECLGVKNFHGFNGKVCKSTITFEVTSNSNSNAEDVDVGNLIVNVGLAAGLKNWTSGKTVPYELHWCVPSSCSSIAVAKSLELSLSPLKRDGRINLLINVNDDDCHTAETDNPVFILTDWLYISLLCTFAAIITASTIYDLMTNRLSVYEKCDPKDKKYLLLTSFSLYTNGKSLLNTQRNKETINCLDGIRYLSICWIIYGHTYYLQVISPQLTLNNVNKMHEDWSNFLVLNGNIVTDTFFLFGGILLTYSELGRKEKESHSYNLNIGMLYLHRYLRLTPAYAIVIGFYATLFYKVGNGPQWNSVIGPNRDYCVDNWWANLLYINNYVQVSNMCMSQSWYLSVDMQLVWISPIFLYPLIILGIKHIVSIIVLSLGLTISILSPLLVTYFKHLPGTMLYYKDQSEVGRVYLEIYTRVYARSGPYIVGLILGYYLRNIRNNSPKLSKFLIFCGWTFSITVSFAVIFGPRGMYFPDHKYNGLEAAFYAGFHRTVLAISIGWIVFATVIDSAGPVGSLLCWSGWVPLSKLTYSAYLTHYLILYYNAGSVRTTGNITTIGTIHMFLGNLGLTMALSVILYLCFEIPFSRLDYLLIRGQKHRSFVAGSFKPKEFGSGESTNEIYRSFDDVSSNVSKSYDEIYPPKDNIEIIYGSKDTTK